MYFPSPCPQKWFSFMHERLEENASAICPEADEYQELMWRSMADRGKVSQRKIYHGFKNEY